MPRRAFVADYDEWEPPTELLELLTEKSLKQRDRVEMIIAFYAADHGGNAPTYDKIGELLHTSRANAYKYAMELTQPWERRAMRKNGKFWLVNSKYTHPVIKERFSDILQAS